jgi:hypothetical protein
MINLYSTESKRFFVTEENGILQDMDRPLNPKDSFMTRKKNVEINEGIPAPADQTGTPIDSNATGGMR